MAQIISLDNVRRSVLFATFSDAAYLNVSVKNTPALKPLLNEFRFSERSTDTQGVMGRWPGDPDHPNDLVIAFRGTEKTAKDWLSTDASVGLVNNRRGTGRLHTGFQRAADSVYQRIKKYIRDIRSPDSRIFLCGHSLGGALATIVAAWLENDMSILSPHAVFTYGAPRVGDGEFVKQFRLQSVAKNTFSWVAAGDPVPHVPPVGFGYRHVKISQYRLQTGSVGKTRLDANARVKLEDDLLPNVPGVKQLSWFAGQVNDAIRRARPASHSIRNSYLRQLKQLQRTLS